METLEKINPLRIQKHDSMLTALKQMDLVKKKLLLVFDDTKFVNVLSIGDIQRAIINNTTLTTPIDRILRSDTRIAKHTDSFELIKKNIYDYRIECMPVVDEDNNLINVYFWEDVYGKTEKRKKHILGLPVVIMAGGKGTRLKPLTNVIPKPLIPLGEKTIIEEIMDRFLDVGCSDFLLSLNYKSETIKQYFETINNDRYRIKYFYEEKPLGTAGSLNLMIDSIKSTFFISNCDIIIDEDYSEILEYHKRSNNEITIVAALRHYPIPYGIIKTDERGMLKTLEEKPELTFKINSGMYIVEPHLLTEIPHDSFFHITHLIEYLVKRKGNVGVFPISEKSWTDIGTMKDYFSRIYK